MKIPGKLACLLACLVVVGVRCPWTKPAGTPEEWPHWIGWPDPMLEEAMLSAKAPTTEAGHHAFRAQIQHPTGLLTSLPDHLPQAGSQSTHSALPPMIATTTNRNQRKSPPRIQVPFGSAIPNKTGCPRGSSAALPINQLSTGPQLDLIPVQSDHCKPYYDLTSEPPSQERPRKRKIRPQRALDEPTHPVMGSVQGSEILPAEPPETLPPQPLMMFDALLFELVGSADVAAHDHHLQQIQIGGIRQLIEASPSKLLVIPEKEFLEHSQLYKSYLHPQHDTPNRQEAVNIDHKKKSRTAINLYSNRRVRLTEKLKEFNEHVDLWYHRWFANTGTHFQIDPNLAHYKFLLPQRRVIIHSLYLFYVEMISSIVPRKSQSTTLASELKLAQEAFERLSKAANKEAENRGDKQSINNAAIEMSVVEEADKLLNKAAEKLKDQDMSHGFHQIFPTLWTYLEFWIDTNRPGIFKYPSAVAGELPVTSKAFFNDVFFHSYTTLFKRCLYQHKATPVFMSKKEK